mgnify:CR=1 FL=1
MWSAYLKDESIISEERDYLLTIHSTPAEYSTFLLFVQTHPNPINAIDASELDTDELTALITTHTGPNAVHVTTGQAQAVYKLLHKGQENGEL